MSGESEALVRALADGHTFILSTEVNRALSAVTFDQLVQEAIARNGDSDLSDATKFDPYAIDFSQPPPAGQQPTTVLQNFASGTNIGLPTRVDRIRAVKNEIDAAVEAMKGTQLNDFSQQQELPEDSRDTIFAGLPDEEFDSQT